MSLHGRLVRLEELREARLRRNAGILSARLDMPVEEALDRLRTATLRSEALLSEHGEEGAIRLFAADLGVTEAEFRREIDVWMGALAGRPCER